MATILSDLPLKKLREMLAATEQSVGRDSVSAAMIRREIVRRENPRAEVSAR